MSDDHDELDDHDHSGFFAVPIGALMRESQEAHDREHMTHTYMQTSIQNFLESLEPDGLQALRLMLHADRESTMNQFFDGMVVAMLRYVHHVDPQTGHKLDEINLDS